MIAKLKIPALLGLALVLPLVLLETIRRRHFDEGFPLALFGILWILAVGFFAVLGHRIPASSLRTLLKVAVLVLIAALWGGIVLDQLPCFLGEPNCD